MRLVVEIRLPEPRLALALVRAAMGRPRLGTGAAFPRFAADFSCFLPRRQIVSAKDVVLRRCEMQGEDLVGETSNVLIVTEVTMSGWHREVRI